MRLKYIHNLDEISQIELNEWYQICDILFFPSLLESFGNPYIEAMATGLPICIIALLYARIVCETAALYFKKDVVEDAVKKIIRLQNSEYRSRLINKGKVVFESFPDTEETVLKFISLAESCVAVKETKSKQK